MLSSEKLDDNTTATAVVVDSETKWNQPYSTGTVQNRCLPVFSIKLVRVLT